MSFIQAAANDTGNVSGESTLTVDFGNPTTLHSTIIVGINLDGNGITVTEVTDDHDQTYVQRVGQVIGGGHTGYIFTCENSVAGVEAITISISTAIDAVAWIAEEGALVQTGNFDNGASQDNDTGSYTSGNAIATQPGDVGYGLATAGAAGSNYVCTGGWAPLVGPGLTNGERDNTEFGLSTLGARQVFPSAGSYAFTCTSEGSAGGAFVALLKTPPQNNAVVAWLR